MSNNPPHSHPGRLIAVYPRKVSRNRPCSYVQQFKTKAHTGRRAQTNNDDCSGRPRRIPIIIDDHLCLTMSNEEACVACINPRRKTDKRSEREVFLRKYEALERNDVASCMRVDLDNVILAFGDLFKCVFCYKAVGIFLRDLNKLKLNWTDFVKVPEHSDPLACVSPFVIGDKEIFIEPGHLDRSKVMADLFCLRMPRIQEDIFNETKGASPCAIHDNDANNYLHQPQVWTDAWKILEAPSKRAVLEIPYSLLVGSITSFLSRHFMCDNCELNIYRSLLYLFEIRDDDYDIFLDEEEEADPIVFDCLFVCQKAELPYNHKTFARKDLTHFKNFLLSSRGHHIHVEESEKLVRELMFLVLPEVVAKVPGERRSASDILGGQNCLLLSLGLIIFRRFQWVWEKYRETRVSVNILSYTLLTLMRTSFENAYEQKRGLMDLDQICKEIEEPKKEFKASKKRAKKKRNKRLQSEVNDENDKNAGNVAESPSKEVVMNDKNAIIAPEPLPSEEVVIDENNKNAENVAESSLPQDIVLKSENDTNAGNVAESLPSKKVVNEENNKNAENVAESSLPQDIVLKSENDTNAGNVAESLPSKKVVNEENNENAENFAESSPFKEIDLKNENDRNTDDNVVGSSLIKEVVNDENIKNADNVAETSPSKKIDLNNENDKKAGNVAVSSSPTKEIVLNDENNKNAGNVPKSSPSEDIVLNNEKDKNVENVDGSSVVLNNKTDQNAEENVAESYPSWDVDLNNENDPNVVAESSSWEVDLNNENGQNVLESSPFQEAEKTTEGETSSSPLTTVQEKVSRQSKSMDYVFNESFHNFSILSLNESLNDDSDDELDERGIPEEDIRRFQESVPDFLLKRAELRQSLKSRFEQLCSKPRVFN